MHSLTQRLLNREDWLKWLEKCPSATFYHTPYWYEGWQSMKGFSIAATLIAFEGVEVFYVCAKKGKLWHLLNHSLSGPAGTYGGFLSRETISARIYDAMVLYAKNTTIGLLVHCPLQSMAVIPAGNQDFTQMIQLDRNFEALQKSWTKGHLSAAKKGIREGIQVRIATSRNDWYDYYSMYKKLLNDWGNQASSYYSLDFFDYLFSLPPYVCKLWLAEYEGKIIVGAIVFYFNKHVTYWHGAGAKDFLQLKGAHVLQYHIIKDALEKQYQWYDMNPSGGHEGVCHFKAGFGTQKFPVITESFIGTNNKLLRYLLTRFGYDQ